MKLDHFKYLDLVIDDKLNFVPHIKKINNKLRFLSETSKQIDNLMNGNTRKIIYRAFIKSHLTYLAHKQNRNKLITTGKNFSYIFRKYSLHNVT